nr:MAG TPA: hypothetical protein [Caudoviricetes sp.]
MFECYLRVKTLEIIGKSLKIDFLKNEVRWLHFVTN